MHKLLLTGMAVSLLPLGAAQLTEDLLVRLQTPLTTTAKAGARFVAVVTGCVRADCRGVLMPGSTIHGLVEEVRPVGFGVRRERAWMALAFDGCHFPDGTRLACETELVSLDNARETVSKGNRIHGILAANHPHSFLGGLWVRPSSALLPRSLSGLTGAGRMLYSGISPHPIVAGAVIVSRLAFLRLPEPEIGFPSGTELIVRVSAEKDELARPASLPVRVDALAEWLAAAPVQITVPDGRPTADIINMAFRGSESDLALAFLGAGWFSADELTGRTFARSYRAFTRMESYPTAPVSPLHYEGRLPDLVFQKSFNCMAKRHHIRLWKVESPEGLVWLGAATHDVGITFEWKRMMLTHRIDREIDRERDKVLADLTFAQCVSGAARVERPAQATDNARVSTDGAIHVLDARACLQPVPAGVAKPKKVSLGKVILRRTILESRHYLLRGNGYYWVFRGLKSRSARTLFTKSVSKLAGRPPLAGMVVGGAGRDRTDE